MILTRKLLATLLPIVSILLVVLGIIIPVIDVLDMDLAEEGLKPPSQ